MILALAYYESISTPKLDGVQYPRTAIASARAMHPSTFRLAMQFPEKNIIQDPSNKKKLIPAWNIIQVNLIHQAVTIAGRIAERPAYRRSGSMDCGNVSSRSSAMLALELRPMVANDRRPGEFFTFSFTFLFGFLVNTILTHASDFCTSVHKSSTSEEEMPTPLIIIILKKKKQRNYLFCNWVARIAFQLPSEPLRIFEVKRDDTWVAWVLAWILTDNLVNKKSTSVVLSASKFFL